MPGSPPGITDEEIEALNARFTERFLRALRSGEPLAVEAGGRLMATIASAPVSLGSRAREVLHHLSYGYTEQQTADRMGVQLSTVKFHTKAIRLKLGARNTPHAVAIALTEGLIR